MTKTKAKKPKKMNAAEIEAASPELHPNYDPVVAEILRQDTQEVITELRSILEVVGPALQQLGPALQQLGRDLPAALEGMRAHAQRLQKELEARKTQ